MIWLLGSLLSVVVSLYLAAPFLARDTQISKSDEMDAYRAELLAIERSEEPEKAKRAILQARLLQAARSKPPGMGKRSLALPLLLGAGLVGSSLALYGHLGAPNFTPETRQAPPPMAESAAPDFNELLPRFEARLAENPDDAIGWNLYGRTLMLAGEIEAGLRAYETALTLSDTPDIRKEYEAAKTFAAQMQSGPDADEIAAMQSLSEADRQAAIQDMVESLRMRLEADPTDAQGWVRLLRSRKVLGQTDAAKDDITALRQALPEQAEDIIAQSGWSD